MDEDLKIIEEALGADVGLPADHPKMVLGLAILRLLGGFLKDVRRIAAAQEKLASCVHQNANGREFVQIRDQH